MNEYGGYKCECHHGYALNVLALDYSSNFISSNESISFRCDDIDECSSDCLNNCDPATTDCINVPGSYQCLCKPGFELSLNSSSSFIECSDINECESDNNPCNPNTSDCINRLGSAGFYCKCRRGFIRDAASGECNDLNECVDHRRADHCSSLSAQCINTIGSFECVCLPGFNNTNQNRVEPMCEDINECNGLDVCDAESKCINEIGSYRCECNAGYIWSTESNGCIDLDECKTNPNNLALNRCDDHADCKNLNGSYECVCHRGWQLSHNNNICIGKFIADSFDVSSTQ